MSLTLSSLTQETLRNRFVVGHGSVRVQGIWINVKLPARSLFESQAGRLMILQTSGRGDCPTGCQLLGLSQCNRSNDEVLVVCHVENASLAVYGETSRLIEASEYARAIPQFRASSSGKRCDIAFRIDATNI